VRAGIAADAKARKVAAAKQVEVEEAKD